ncbi:hypothetical protein AMJ85_08980 [candidate division BRC1 bacterium SM23_51]|nr:MAG: hypothetical protein AMJ85_08980 [candidate division BRC1 bacterium SM23_51]
MLVLLGSLAAPIARADRGSIPFAILVNLHGICGFEPVAVRVHDLVPDDAYPSVSRDGETVRDCCAEGRKGID